MCFSLDRARLILDRASSATAGCKGSEDDSKGERERRRGRGGSRGRSSVGGGNGLWRKAEGDAFIIRIAGLFWSPEPFRLFEICSVEGEKERGGIGSYEDVKDGERNSEGKRRRRSLRLAKETREVWMVFEECHVIIGPPFERPFQREAAPPLGSARLGSARLGSARFRRSVPLGRRVSLN